jgi:hypothetical protein
MCNPAVVLVVAQVASGALSAKASADQGRYNRSVAEYNAAVDKNRAEEIKSKANIAESEERQRTQQLSSRQRVTAAARGVEIGFGTPLALTEGTERIGEISALRIRKGAEEQASALQTQAELTEAGGRQAERQGRIGAAATLIGSAGAAAGALSTPGKVAPKWFQLGQGTSGTTQSPFSLIRP